MRRVPVVAFLILVVATIAAFFITQHLKVSTPLLAGPPRPFPSAINPIDGATCYDPVSRQKVNYRQTTVSFYLLHQSDTVDVYIVDQQGKRVATLATHRFMQGGDRPIGMTFAWDGRVLGGAVASPGVYYVQVHLTHQDRIVTISDNTGPLPVRVDTSTRCP